LRAFSLVAAAALIAAHAKGHIGLQHGLGNKDTAGVANDKGVVKFRKLEIKAL